MSRREPRTETRWTTSPMVASGTRLVLALLPTAAATSETIQFRVPYTLEDM